MAPVLHPPAVPACAMVVSTARGPALRTRHLTGRPGEDPTAARFPRDVSLEVVAGEFLAIAGGPGAGKSALVRLLAGLDRPASGQVIVGGRDLATMDGRELARLRRREMCLLLPGQRLPPVLTVAQSLALRLRRAGRRVDEGWREAVLFDLGLGAQATRRPARLSGDERWRAALARALVAEPALLLADEPAADLDCSGRAAAPGLLRRAVDAYGQTTVLLTRDAATATAADRVLVLAGGAVVDELRGAGEAVIRRAMLQD